MEQNAKQSKYTEKAIPWDMKYTIFSKKTKMKAKQLLFKFRSHLI